MSKYAIRGGAALASIALLGAAGASTITPAGAATPASLTTVQQKAAAAISLRITDLNTATTTVHNTPNLGSGAGALAAYLQADIAPLQALGQKIAGDTSVKQAEADASTIYSNFRVLALVLPGAKVAGAADEISLTFVPVLTADSAKAQARVNPSNQGIVQPLINDLNSQLSAASGSTSALANTVESYTAAQWNANHNVLSSAHTSVGNANADLSKARTDLMEIRADLKGGIVTGPKQPPAVKTPRPPRTTTPTTVAPTPAVQTPGTTTPTTAAATTTTTAPATTTTTSTPGG